MHGILLLACAVIFPAAWPAEVDAVRKVPTIQEFFNGLNKDTMALIDDFYDANATFEDPVGTIHGRAGLRKYYGKQYENVISIKFDFGEEAVNGADHFVRWTMNLRHKTLNSGKPIVVPGVTFARFDPKAGGKVTYQRDYFDMGAFVYERLPVLGFVIRSIRNTMAKMAH